MPSLIKKSALGYLIHFQICILVKTTPHPSPPPVSFPGVRVDGRFILLSSATLPLLYLSLELFPNKLLKLLTPTQHLLPEKPIEMTDVKENLKI